MRKVLSARGTQNADAFQPSGPHRIDKGEDIQLPFGETARVGWLHPNLRGTANVEQGTIMDAAPAALSQKATDETGQQYHRLRRNPLRKPFYQANIFLICIVTSILWKHNSLQITLRWRRTSHLCRGRRLAKPPSSECCHGVRQSVGLSVAKLSRPQTVHLVLSPSGLSRAAELSSQQQILLRVLVRSPAWIIDDTCRE